MVSTTSVWPRLTRCSSIWSMLKCVLTPANRIFPACLGGPLDLQQLIGHLRGCAPVVEVPDVEVVGAEFAQAGVEVVDGLLLGLRRALAGENDLLALALESRTHHALVVAVLVTARRVEMHDAEIGRAHDHRRVRGGHAAERKRSQLQSGLAQRAVRKLRLLRGSRGGRRCRRCRESSGRQSQPGRQKGTP